MNTELVDFYCKPCMVCGKKAVIQVSLADLVRYQQGSFVQDVWPNWKPEERELIITGTHPECWNRIFGEDENENLVS